MRGFLLLSVVGAFLYGFLLLSADVPDRKAEHSLSSHTERHDDRTMRSWGHNLPALLTRQPSNDRPRAAVGDDLLDLSQENLATVRGVQQAQLETAGVVLAARVHSEPSVSFPTVRFFAPGTELQVVRRESGWVELFDPATQERGWVFESYVWSKGDFSRAQNASLRKEDELAKPTKQALPRSKQRSRPAITVPQTADEFSMESELRPGRWARRGEPRRRFGLFGRRAASW
jgi:hypothetical protein